MISAFELAKAVLMIVGSAGGAWLAIRIELRWLRSDVNRLERRLDTLDLRIFELE
jgi:hypothetical protein